MNRWLPYASAVLSLLTATLVGCGSGNELERAVLSGKVTLAGNPVPDGEIRLKSLDGAPMPVSVGTIKQGNYKIDIRGGVPVGQHRVMIEAIRPIPGAKPIPIPDMGTEHMPTEQYIPAKYNKKSTLQVTIEPGAAAVTHDFNLEL